MIYKTYYNSPIGKILLVSCDDKLIGLWFEGQKYYLGNIKAKLTKKDDEKIFIQVKKWLDRYFNEEKPSLEELELNPQGTEFQKSVWQELMKIPYGKITTYGNIAKNITKKHNKKIANQAIGGAIGRNPISIIIPCHRVLSHDGSLNGYAGGLKKKDYLLKLESGMLDEKM